MALVSKRGLSSVGISVVIALAVASTAIGSSILLKDPPSLHINETISEDN